jgi:hypothetical protein
MTSSCIDLVERIASLNKLLIVQNVKRILARVHLAQFSSSSSGSTKFWNAVRSIEANNRLGDDDNLQFFHPE